MLRLLPFLSLVASVVIDRPSLDPNIIAHAVAEFGPQVLGDPTYPDSFPAVTATLVGYQDDGTLLDGCDESQIPTTVPDTWFLLAIRGNCEFASKAEMAQDAGAAGVIVYNSVDDGELVIMHEGDGNDILIPSVFVTYEAGADLLHLMANMKDGVVVTLNATGCELNCGPWDNQWQISVLWFLFIAFLAMWVVVLVCFSTALCRRWCHRSARQRAVGSLRRRKFKKVVAPPATISSGDSKDEESGDEAATAATHDPDSKYQQDSCVICLCEFENGDNLMVLPCQHEFHTECINPWLLKKSSKCPICKTSCMPKPTPAAAAADQMRAPLLDSASDSLSYDPEAGRGGEDDEENQAEDDDDDDDDVDPDDVDSDDERTDVWNTQILGLHPGALVLAGACCTGVGIAVAIMIFLLQG